jgi:RNA polymerase sigma-70 factor (ECF subfamily)
MAARLCRSQLDPGDLVQDVLERLVANVDRIPAELPVRAWLVRVMHNRFIDMVRRQHPTAAVEPEQLAEAPREPEAWWHRLSTEDVRAKIDALPPELRDAFRMFSIEGKSYPGDQRAPGRHPQHRRHAHPARAAADPRHVHRWRS